MGLYNKTLKLQTCGYDSKLEIVVQKIEVKKCVFNSYLSQFIFIFILSPIL